MDSVKTNNILDWEKTQSQRWKKQEIKTGGANLV